MHGEFSALTITGDWLRIAEDPAQHGLGALGSRLLEQRVPETISSSPALWAYEWHYPIPGGKQDSLSPSIQIRLLPRFSLGYELAGVITTENKWGHYQKNKENKYFLKMLMDRRPRQESRVIKNTGFWDRWLGTHMCCYPLFSSSIFAPV